MKLCTMLCHNFPEVYGRHSIFICNRLENKIKLIPFKHKCDRFISIWSFGLNHPFQFKRIGNKKIQQVIKKIKSNIKCTKPVRVLFSDAAAYEMFSLFVLHTVCSLHQKERLFLTVPRPCLPEPMQY